jgi:hypothetical protein
MRRIILAAVMALSACEAASITGNECSPRYACQVAGVDLAVVSVAVESGVPHYSGAVIVDPADITISFVVVNRGDRISGRVPAEASLFGEKHTVELPPIAPGDSASGVASVTIDRAYLLEGDDRETENAIVRLLPTDAATDNNVLAGPRVGLTIPFVTLNPVITPPQTVRVGERIKIWFSGVFGNQVDVWVCLRAGNRTCTAGNWEPIIRFQPRHGGLYTEYPLSATAVPAPAAGEYQLIYCTVPTADTGTHLDPGNPNHRCRPGGMVTVTGSTSVPSLP